MELSRTTYAGAASMRSPVNWALLGLVIERPSYGYELAQRFESVYGDVLQVSSASHIYTALNALQSRAFIEELPGRRTLQGGRQPKPHYCATELGARCYRERLVAQMHEDRSRSQLFVRQLAVFIREPQTALEVLERYEQMCLEEASRTPLCPPGATADLGSAELDSAALDGSARGFAGGPDLVSRLTAEENRLAADARLSWVEYARREFGALVRGRDARR